jgi:hypothetical protein
LEQIERQLFFLFSIQPSIINKILGVHINSITGKDKLTKPLGPNPFRYLGVTYSQTGVTRTLHQVLQSKWLEFAEIDSCASDQISAVPQQYRGKGFNFSQWFPIYDWEANDGYTNFSSWTE